MESLLANISVKKKILAIIMLLVFTMVLIGVYSFYDVRQIIINGDMYNNIARNKDLVSDILPPPLFVVESYATALRLSHEQDKGKIANLVEDLKGFRKNHEERNTYWKSMNINHEIRMLLHNKSYAQANQLFDVVLSELVPAVQAKEQEKVYAIVTGKLQKLFDEHKRTIDEMAALLIKEVESNEKKASQTIEHMSVSVVTASVAGICISIIFSLYISGLITKPLSKLVLFASDVANGKFNGKINISQGDEVGRLAVQVIHMVEELKSLIERSKIKSAEAEEEYKRAMKFAKEAADATKASHEKQEIILAIASELQGVAGVIKASSAQISEQIDHASQGAHHQSSRIEETSTAMEEMNTTVAEVAHTASDTKLTAAKAKDKAEDGARIVGKVVEGIWQLQSQSLGMKNDMANLGKQAEGIGQVLNVISDIADQTNLLALNAAIEAARAGDAGRGFAVVADEVRKLAEKTMTATKEVGDAIHGIQEGTRINIENVDKTATIIEEATTLVSDSGNALVEIVSLVDLASTQVDSIAVASEEQSAASDEINRSLEEVNRISTETAEAMVESAEAITQLTRQAHILADLVGRMRGEELTFATEKAVTKPVKFMSVTKPALVGQRQLQG